jgi:hypothetical protein
MAAPDTPDPWKEFYGKLVQRLEAVKPCTDGITATHHSSGTLAWVFAIIAATIPLLGLFSSLWVTFKLDARDNLFNWSLATTIIMSGEWVICFLAAVFLGHHRTYVRVVDRVDDVTQSLYRMCVMARDFAQQDAKLRSIDYGLALEQRVDAALDQVYLQRRADPDKGIPYLVLVDQSV